MGLLPLCVCAVSMLCVCGEYVSNVCLFVLALHLHLEVWPQWCGRSCVNLERCDDVFRLSSEGAARGDA